MKISVLVPSLRNTGPILVARDIIVNLSRLHQEIEFCLFYFDKVDSPITVDCAVYHIRDIGNLHKLFESDIVHSHGIRPDLFVFRNRKKLIGKCVTTIHCLLSKEYAVTYNKFIAFSIEYIWTKIVRRHNKVAVLSETMKKHYASYLPSESMIVINNGRDLSKVSIDESDESIFKSLKQKYNLLGVACVLNKRKGLQQVIDILPMLPEYAFVIIGDGPERKNLENQAIGLGVDQRCIFLGSRVEANRYNCMFDYYIFPSYMEGLPLSLLEAAGMSKAIICSDLDIHREIFNEDEVSFFRIDDSVDLIRAVKKAQAEKEMLEQKACATYQNKFTADIMANSYHKLYRCLVDMK